MADDYKTTIADLLTVRDQLVANLNAAASDLAALPVVAAVSEGGDGGPQSIDVPGMRRELMDEIREYGTQVKEISITIASLQAGIGMRRIHTRGCRW